MGALCVMLLTAEISHAAPAGWHRSL